MQAVTIMKTQSAGMGGEPITIGMVELKRNRYATRSMLFGWQNDRFILTTGRFPSHFVILKTYTICNWRYTLNLFLNKNLNEKFLNVLQIYMLKVIAWLRILVYWLS